MKIDDIPMPKLAASEDNIEMVLEGWEEFEKWIMNNDRVYRDCSARIKSFGICDNETRYKFLLTTYIYYHLHFKEAVIEHIKSL